MRAIYFRALHVSAAMPVCGRREFRVCGKLSRYLNYSAVTFLNRLLEERIAVEENGYNVTFYLKTIPLLVITVTCDISQS